MDNNSILNNNQSIERKDDTYNTNKENITVMGEQEKNDSVNINPSSENKQVVQVSQNQIEQHAAYRPVVQQASQQQVPPQQSAYGQNQMAQQNPYRPVSQQQATYGQNQMVQQNPYRPMAQQQVAQQQQMPQQVAYGQNQMAQQNPYRPMPQQQVAYGQNQIAQQNSYRPMAQQQVAQQQQMPQQAAYGQNQMVQHNPYGQMIQQQGYYTQNGWGYNQPSGTGDYYNTQFYPNKPKSVWKIPVIITSILVACIFIFVFIAANVIENTDNNASVDADSLEERIEREYGVVINVGKEADCYESGYSIEKLTNDRTIKNALVHIENILDRLPEGFMEDLMSGYSDAYDLGHDRYLEINITGSMTDESDGRTVLGLTSYSEEKTVIRMDATVFSWDEYELTFAHELFHVIDFEMDQFEYTIDLDRWEDCNPSGYQYSYGAGQSSKYVDSSDVSDCYFVSYYSKEDIYEDRAEIFSYLLATASDEELPKVYDSEHIQDKVELLVSEIESHFRTVDESAYWNRWY